MPRPPAEIARQLLGLVPDEVETLVAWPDHAAYRVRAGSRRWVLKTDDDRATIAREVEGLQRAAGAGVAVPELLAVADDALAIAWVDGIALHRGPAAPAWRAAGAQLRTAHDLRAPSAFGDGFGGGAGAFVSWRAFFERFTDDVIARCRRDHDFPPAQADRIRAAVADAAPLLDAPHIGWCHGDLQPDHVLVDPATDRVAAIIDWADHGAGDVVWDVTIVGLDRDTHLDAFLDGYGADAGLRAAIRALRPLYGVVRLVGEANWLAEHGCPFADNLRRALDWRG